MQALERANYVRLSRVDLKRRIRAGEASVADLLLDPPDFLETMRAEHLILSIRRFQRARFRRVMHAMYASLGARVCDLTLRQRRILADDVRAYEEKQRKKAAA